MLANPKNNVTDLKVPPHAIEAEQSVLGGLMLSPELFETATDILKPGDFFVKNHRTIFKTMIELVSQSKPIDVITVSERLEDKDIGLGYLGDLAQNTPSAANLKTYCEIVKEKSILRQIIQANNEISDLAFNPKGKSIPEIVNQFEQQLLQIANQNEDTEQSYTTNDEALKELVYYVEQAGKNKGLLGLSTGFTDFDNMTSGLQPADLVIIAARPSMGKTTFAMNIANHVAENSKYPAVVFSLEMPTKALKIREISAKSGLDHNMIKTGQIKTKEDWEKFNSAIIQQQRQQNIVYCDKGGISPAYAKSQLNKIAKRFGGISAVVVDYLQLMKIEGYENNRTLEVSEISRQLKNIAKSFDVPVIALSQLNRNLEARSNKRPTMSDLRDSGAIEQDADLIAFIYRDEVYNEESPKKGIAEIIIGKQRNGPIGSFELVFDGAHATFKNLAYFNDGIQRSEFKENQRIKQ